MYTLVKENKSEPPSWDKYIDKRIRSAFKLSDIETKAILVNNIAVSTREVRHPLGVLEKGSNPLR